MYAPIKLFFIYNIVQEPKKLMRYLDGRIVSTKGERRIDIKEPESADMKKTYINLKPAKKYKFH